MSKMSNLIIDICEFSAQGLTASQIAFQLDGLVTVDQVEMIIECYADGVLA